MQENENSFWRKVGSSIKMTLSITFKYFGARLLISLIIAVLAGVAFALLKFPAWWLLALVVGLANIIPMIGPWASAIIVGLVLIFANVVAKGESWLCVLWGLFVILGSQILDEFLLSPLLMGKAIDLKPLSVFLVIMVAGACLGFWGILFALPIAASAKAVYNIFIRDNTIQKGDTTDGNADTHGRGE